MKPNVTAHHLLVHSATADLLPVRPRRPWPWTTALLAVGSFLLLATLLWTIERRFVANLPPVRALRFEQARARERAALQRAAQERLARLQQALADGRQAFDGLAVVLHEDLHLAGAGPSYAAFETPPALDALIAAEDTASAAWSRVEAALTARPRFADLQTRTATLRGAAEFDAAQVAELDALLATANTVADQARDAREAAQHLVILFKAQELRLPSTDQKEPSPP